MENWRFIEANSDYMVSDHGRILSFKGKSKLIISSSITAKGYEYVAIRQKGIYVGYSVHRLVATAFIPNPKRLPQVNHLDGNKLNNHVANLEWCDAYDNVMHAIRTGLRPSSPALSPVPCATTDEAGNILQAYPSMNALVKGEQMNPKQRNWLVLHLLHPERLKQSAMKKKPRAERSGSEECFLIAPEIPVLTVKADSIGEFEAGNLLGTGKSSNSIGKSEAGNLFGTGRSSNSVGESEAGNVCVQSVSSPLVSSPLPLISLFVPVHHSVTQHYYRRLSPEESAIFGFNTYILPREREQRKEFLQ
ncbi:endonuclease [Bacteroides thetaiotaomicron]|nr:endonuclease [Bacteroides thetaiotaomicron]